MLTVFCPFTRTWAVDPFFDALELSDVPLDRFVAYCDTDDPTLEERVRARAGCFREVSVTTSGRPTMPDGAGPFRRRIGHALMRVASQGLVSDGPLLLLEDDTLIPRDTYAPLCETLRSCDWAIGVEVGRWLGGQMPGVWRIARDAEGLSRLSAAMDGDDIDASGFYCVLTTGALYKSMDFTTWNERIGFDVHTTYRLTEAGYRLKVDRRVECVHFTPTAKLYVRDATPYSASLRNCERLPLKSIGRVV